MILTSECTLALDDTKLSQGKIEPSFYRPELDVLRLLAFLAVFVRHSTYDFWPTVSRAGAYGLSLFFLLSAFLITELLQREKNCTGQICLHAFYIRRALRIWPLYYGFLVLALALGWLLPHYGAGIGYSISFACMVGNFYLACNGVPAGPITPLWSISVEEQFYLFWPVLNRYCSKRSLLLIALSAFLIGSAAVVVLANRGDSPTVQIWTNSLVAFQFFACGILLSLILKGTTPVFPVGVRGALMTFGVSLWLAAARWMGVNNIRPTSPVSLVSGYALICIGSSSIFLSLLGIKANRMPRPFIYLGKISYGLYVFHTPCLDLASWGLKAFGANAPRAALGISHVLCGFLLTVAAASLSYRYFETPFLNLKKRFTTIHLREADGMSLASGLHPLIIDQVRPTLASGHVSRAHERGLAIQE